MSRVKVHTVDQPDSDTTTFVLSCNRLDVLDQTLDSFYRTRDYTTKMVIVDDSAEPGIFETLVERYGSDCDVICFPRNRSQWWAMDFMVSYCDTDYIFYLEDDWELLQPGYLNASKYILNKYREVGVVDISWRTFEWQGIDSYEKKLIDNMFYWKKPWKITDHHLAWHCWIGSPNLRRRDDLIMLGRVEKWFNESNIDRKFTALGFKGVYLNGEYARHLGDLCSRMAGKRPNDATIPYDYIPPELLKNRRAPFINYREMDYIYEYPADVTLVTGFIDINRSDRDFEEHYLKGLDEILKVRNPLVVYCDPKYHDYVYARRKELSIATSDNKVQCYSWNEDNLRNNVYFNRIQQIITKDEWINQAEWIKTAPQANPLYIPLTLMKNELLEQATQFNPHHSKRFFWIDAGMWSSFGIKEPITDFDFLKLSKSDKMFMTAYPYLNLKEMHGYDMNKMVEITGTNPKYVCRATLFGGSPEAIHKFNEKFYRYIEYSLAKGAMGTEESIFTIVDVTNPELVERYDMPSGDITYYLNTIKKAQD